MLTARKAKQARTIVHAAHEPARFPFPPYWISSGRFILECQFAQKSTFPRRYRYIHPRRLLRQWRGRWSMTHGSDSRIRVSG